MPSHQPDAPYWVRFCVPGLGYFTYNGVNYDRGQLIALSGGPHDEQLVRMGYVGAVDASKSHLQAECGECSTWFVSEQFRDQHGRMKHRSRFQDDRESLEVGAGMAGPAGGAALRDITGDAEERRMMQDMPLYLDKTAATLAS